MIETDDCTYMVIRRRQSSSLNIMRQCHCKTVRKCNLKKHDVDQHHEQSMSKQDHSCAGQNTAIAAVKIAAFQVCVDLYPLHLEP